MGTSDSVGLKSAESRYLYALCCLQLGKLPEAEAALKGDQDLGGQVRRAIFVLSAFIIFL